MSTHLVKANFANDCSSSLLYSLSNFRKSAMSEKKGKKRARKPSSTSEEEEEEEEASTSSSCPICGHGHYKHPRSVHQHIKRKHPGYKKLSEMKVRISEATRMLKEKCPHCQAMRTQLKRHLKKCPSRPELAEATEANKASTNSQFVQRFRAYLKRPGSGFAESTVRNYLNYIRLIIAHEVRLDANFTASQWFAPSTSTEFRSLRNADEYIPATNFGSSSVANFGAVYKILWDMIRENLLKPLNDPLSRHERSLASLRTVQKRVRRGRDNRNKNPDSGLEDRIDPSLTERLLDNYFDSERRQEIFIALSEGELMESGQAALFLGETFLHLAINSCWISKD